MALKFLNTSAPFAEERNEGESKEHLQQQKEKNTNRIRILCMLSTMPMPHTATLVCNVASLIVS